MSKCLNHSRLRIVRWVHDALSTAGELARTMSGGDPVPRRTTEWHRRLAMEGLETRQLLTATLLHTLNNPTPEEGDSFGSSGLSGVAVSGNTVVVAGTDDTVAENAGSVYVFDATTGALLHTLNKPTPEAGDGFGSQLAISGNMVVTRAYSTRAFEAMNVYVFDATTGALLHTLDDPFVHTSSLAISENTIVVGDAGTEEAYFFDAATGTLLRTLHAPHLGGSFGIGVAISGNTVVVGAPNTKLGSVEIAGCVYVFDATTGALLQTLNNPTPERWDSFGMHVATSGNRVFVSQHNEDAGAENAGCVYVFDATTGALLHTLNNPNPKMDDHFGKTAVWGNRVVVGADARGTGRGGRAYVFDATTWALLDTLSSPSLDDCFGQSVAISGDRVVVAAPLDHTGATGAGIVYVFSLGDADFNDDGLYDVADIDLLSAAIAFGNHPSSFDLTDDGLVNLDDQNAWLVTAGAANLPSGMPYPLADANLDGWFDSSDFVQVFQAGKYENGIENDAVWSTGDWNGDGDFDSADFVVAFQTGLYEVKSPVASNPLATAVDWLFAQNQRPARRRAYVM